MFLFHGLTGDERSMGIFAARIPENYWLISPRGIYGSGHQGYSWVPKSYKTRPSIEDFGPTIAQVLDLVEKFHRKYHLDLAKFHIMGFSQGAALCYAIALTQPERVASLAGLSGFMPSGTEPLITNSPLAGRQFFITHGTLDTLVPVNRAREAIRVLQAAGAEVTYCEADVGHKLGATCFRSLAKFYRVEYNSTHE
jgi:phospholipase/carboxylesterase